MTAKEKFTAGMRVQVSAEAQRTGVPKTHLTAVVIGFGRTPEIVRVMREGLHSVESYHMDIWDLIAAPATAGPEGPRA